MIFVSGHRNPDTDSIAAAIAAANLKQAQNIAAMPVRLGPISKETQGILDRFGFEAPALLKDARITLEEIELDTCPTVDMNAPVIEALKIMDETGIPYTIALDEKGNAAGLLTRTDIARIGLSDTARAVDLLANVKTEDMVKTLDGTMIYDDNHTHLNGKVSILAATNIQNYQLHDRIAICGNDPLIQKEAIYKGAGMLILVWTEYVHRDVVELARDFHCPILISGHGAMNTSRYLYFSIPVNKLMSKKLVSFEPQDVLENAMKVMRKYRYRVYPVIKDGKLLGSISPQRALADHHRKFILVDHNEFSQSVENIEKAEILEVIDHHRIADFASRLPLNFRSEPVGSTCTIVADMFMERNLEISKNIAGLMLSGIISDTLNFQSVTTTEKDIRIGQILSDIAGLDMDELANDIFSRKEPLTQDDVDRLVYQDMKRFNIDGNPVLIAQYISSSLDLDEELLQSSINNFVRTANCSLYVLALTDVSKQGSYFYKAGPLASQIGQIESKLYPGVVSRKKQILPMVTEWISQL